MVALADLWLPILLSGVFVFVVSSIVHMCLPIHKGDYAKLPSEAEVLGGLRNHGVQPGSYMFPSAASMKDLGTPEMLEKFQQGPVGYMTVLPNGAPAVGKSLLQWIVFSLLLTAVVAHLAAVALPADAAFKTVFHFTALASFLGYGLSNCTDSIWKGVSWVTTAKFLFDGALYGVTTGATFGWLWPAAGG